MPLDRGSDDARSAACAVVGAGGKPDGAHELSWLDLVVRRAPRQRSPGTIGLTPGRSNGGDLATAPTRRWSAC